jgi:hypothetical protein
VDNAGNSQVWLDISGIDSYRFTGAIYEPEHSSRNHLYIPQYDVMVNFGVFDKASPHYHKSVLPTREYTGDILLKGITLLLHGSKWASLQPLQKYFGTLSPAETIKILKHLKSMHDDDIKGLKGSLSGIELISFDELINVLKAKQNSWKPVELP